MLYITFGHDARGNEVINLSVEQGTTSTIKVTNGHEAGGNAIKITLGHEPSQSASLSIQTSPETSPAHSESVITQLRPVTAKLKSQEPEPRDQGSRDWDTRVIVEGVFILVWVVYLIVWGTWLYHNVPFPWADLGDGKGVGNSCSCLD